MGANGWTFHRLAATNDRDDFAGTEVLPGERKFTDYAFPAGQYSMPLSTVQNTGGRVGWHQSPLPGPFDLPSRYNPYGW
jgi:hypothetical protein